MNSDLYNKALDEWRTRLDLYDKAMDELGLDLGHIRSRLRQLAYKAFIEGDAVGILVLMDNTVELDFVTENMVPLTKRGIFEAALVEAFTDTRVNNHRWPVSTLQKFLDEGDINKLRAAGNPLPEGNVYTIYRGVSGKRPYRHVRGLAWTASLEQACWFATRYFFDGAEDPAVYKARIKKDDVYFYMNERNEQEFVCRPKTAKRMKLSIKEMLEMADEKERKTE